MLKIIQYSILTGNDGMYKKGLSFQPWTFAGTSTD